jgi:hypothetical protein
MQAILLLTQALEAAAAAQRLYAGISQLYASQLTAEEKATLAAKEEALFAQPQWQPAVSTAAKGGA